MSKTITSGSIVFMDATDENRLDLYISSNQPNIQILNTTSGAYTPDWGVNNLQLNAVAYMGTVQILNGLEIEWYQDNISNSTKVGTGSTLTISTNVLANRSTVTYICKATYNDVNASKDITFSKVQTVTNILSTTVQYAKSTTFAQPSEQDWKSELPVVSNGEYLWTRTITDYSDKSIPDSVVITYVKQGDKGETGAAGSSVTVSSVKYQEGTSATSAPTGTWQDAVVSVSAGNYLWTKTTFSDGKVAYGVARQGKDGDQGVQGPKGNDGQQYYTWVKYADTPTSGMSNDPDGKAYIGLAYNKTTATESTTYSDYMWSLIKGETGAIGPKGSDGQTYYTWIKYADNASGANMSDSPTGKSYIGLAYNKTTSTESNTASDYTWALFKGDKGNQGDRGAGINSVTVTYGTSTSASTQPTSWQSTLPTVAEGSYLWTRTVTDYTDDAIADTVTLTYAKQGAKGSTGTAGTSVTVSSIQYQAGTSATTAPTGTWSDTVVTVSAGSYLWTKTTFSDGKVAYGVARQGSDGAKGATGSAGADAYTVLLSNESHVFAGDVSNAIASTATTQVLAYKGTTAQTVTIVSVNGVTAATASTATGIAGLSFACSALSGTTPTITFTCTTSFVSQSGSIPIVISVGGVSITKMFTYSIAFKGSTGATGGAGAAGAAATAYWLISDASVVQKSNSGSVVLTPSTLTFTGKSKTGTSAPADYKCRWIIAYSTDGSAYTNSYTSSADEASKTFTVDSSYKSIRVRMYLAGGTSTLLDEQIIPVVADGAVGTPGMDAVTFQIYSSNGYALSTNAPNVTLQTFAYVGDVAITAGATYQWYKYSTSGWSAISSATNAYLTISRDDVVFSQSYMCKMTFNGVDYTSVATIDDKNDNNKVFTTKPSNYAAGDIWIVGVDYIPAGVEVGTLLRAEHTNTTYEDSDWVTAMKYDSEIDDLKSNIDTYNQYFSFDSVNGVTISAVDANGASSQFSTSLTNERLSFNYGNESIAYINGTKMNIKEAEIESPLTVTGKYSGSTMLQAPVINIGNFSIIVESNGSLSIVANI